MRQGKISALIHKSSAHPDATSCTVDIHFRDVIDQPDGSFETVPGSTLVVSRSAFKTNVSRYSINGKDSSFTEVTTLMRDRGIDLDHKRFLILQGEVESIAQMKPKAENNNDDGLLEYLEDIIGTSDYKKTIEDAESQLESLNEDFSAKSNRLDIVKKEIKTLQAKKDEVVRNLKLENEMVFKQSVFFQYKIYRLKTSIQTNKGKLEKLQAQLANEREATQGAKEEIVRLEEQVKEQGRELSELKKRHAVLAKALAKCELQKVSVEERAKQLASKKKKLEKNIVASQHSFNEVDSWIKNYDEEANNARDKIPALERDLAAKNQEYNKVQESLKGKTEGISKQIEAIQTELSPWRDQIAAKESEIAIAQGAIDLISEKHESAKRSLKEAKTKIAQVAQEGQEKESKVETLQEELHHTTEQIKLGTAHVKSAAEERIRIKRERDDRRLKYQVAKESVSDAKSQGAVLSSLTKLANSGRVEGFNGRLGSLGTIDQKYDVAVSTACPALDNLVVDTVAAGESCVEYLRRNNVGRARFILLDKIPRRDLSPIKTPENVPRLFDLVQPKEPRFAQAFYSVLFDTLVAKDVDQASRIAYGARRFRVVTLDGVLIDTSGTMSGGGQKARGRMKDRLEGGVSTQELEQLEMELNEHESRYQKAESAFEKMTIKLKELEQRKPQLELEISKTNLDIEALSVSLKEAQSYYKELKRNFTTNLPSGDELQEKQEIKEQLEQELQVLKSNSADLENQIKTLNEKIMEIGGVKLRFLKSEIDGISGEIEMINSRLSTQVLERTKRETARKKYQRAIENAQQELLESEHEFTASEQEVRIQEAEVSKIEQEKEEIRVILEEKEDQLAELKATAKEKRDIVDKTLSAEIEFVNSIEGLEKTLKESERRVGYFQKEQKDLKLHAIGDIPDIDVGNVKEATQTQGDGEQARSEEEEDSGEEHEDEKQTYTEFIEYTDEQLENINREGLEQEIESLKESLKDVTINMDAIFEYSRRAKEYFSRQNEVNLSLSERDEMKNRCETFRKKRLDEFLEGFNSISLKLKEMYQMITMGGNAELELVDSLDPFSEGILFSVMPPKKSWKNISNLSGGEKTLSSLALVFALHHYKPTPLYVMDEIDAALDFRNVSIVANYIKERTKNGQFIVISLRNNMFELASQLVGIYKVNNMTKSVAIKNKDHNHEQIQRQQVQQQKAQHMFSQMSQPSFSQSSLSQGFQSFSQASQGTPLRRSMHRNPSINSVLPMSRPPSLVMSTPSMRHPQSEKN